MKILAQGSSSLDKVIREAALAAPNLVSRCLERLDAALFFELGKETFGGGRRSEAVRLDRRTVATTVGVASFKRRHYIDRAMGRRCHPLDELIGLSPRSRVSDEMRPKAIEAASRMPHSKAAAWASPMAPISKSTVARIIADVGVAAAGKPVEKGGKVHVQIDEKYVKMDGKPNKTRLVTAARFGKFGGSFNRKTVEKISLVIEARLNGWDLTLSSSALKPASPSSLGPLGKPYEDRMKHDIDTSEMSYGMRKLFSQIEYGVPS